MSETRGTKLTYQGLQALARANIGEHLNFTRVVMGDGKVSVDQDLRQLTGLVNPIMTLPIKDVKVTGKGTSVIETQLKNINIVTGFFSREVGIFATIGDDVEILYAVRNTGDDSEYIPGGGGSEVWDIIYDVVTVIDQAQNVTANINGDIAYVTRLDFYEHRDSENPHPNMLQIGSTVTDCTNVFVNQGNQRLLNQMTMDDFRTKVLGAQASTIPALSGRVTQLEREQVNISLALVAQQIYPDYNMLLSEDFVVPDKIDTFVCNVLSVVAGDNGIDVETLYAIVPGAWYTISDGVNSEYFQVRSCIKNGSVFRILANTNLTNTYKIEETLILRSTAKIAAGVVYGSGDKKGFNWSPSLVWQGVNANVASTIKLETVQEKSDEFEIDGDIAFTSGGLATLGGE